MVDICKFFVRLLLTSWSTVLYELMVTHQVKKFPAHCGKQSFFAVIRVNESHSQSPNIVIYNAL